MEHSLKELLVIVALGAAVASSPAFARSELNGHQQRFARSELNGHQQRLPRDANISITNGIWKDIHGRRIDLRAFLIGTLPVAAVVEKAHGITVGAGFWAPVSRATR
jgi:hypothetical protein